MHNMKLLKMTIALGAALLMGSVGANAQQALKVGRTAPVAGQVQFFAPAVQAIADDAGIQIQFQDMPFGDLMTALAEKRIDIVAGPITKTPEREAIADFTQPFASFRDVAIVPIADARAYTTIADFKGSSVGVVRGAIYVPPLKQAGANVVEVEATANLITELAAGRVVATFNTNVNALFLVSTNPGYKIVDSYAPMSLSEVALEVQKGNAPLLAKLNASIAKLKANGALKTIAEKAGYTYRQ
jgi:polar amino acid transport system substrate-binding protein